MGDLIGMATNASLVGGLGGLISVGLQFLDAKSKRDHELAVLEKQNQNAKELREMDIANAAKLANIEADTKQTLAMIDAQARADEANSADLRSSRDADKPTHFQVEQTGWVLAAMTFVDFCRGMVRPLATGYLLVLYTFMLFWVFDMYSQKVFVITSAQAFDFSLAIFQLGLAGVSGVLVFYFNVRTMGKTK
jgi:hypothetical protein